MTGRASERLESDPTICPKCGESRLTDVDILRRRRVCQVCSNEWPLEVSR
jgi:uncharacterized protein (DUF983 family)